MEMNVVTYSSYFDYANVIFSFVRTPCRVPDVGRFLNIPEEWSAGIDTHHPGIPPLFIVQAQVSYDCWYSSFFCITFCPFVAGVC